MNQRWFSAPFDVLCRTGLAADVVAGDLRAGAVPLSTTDFIIVCSCCGDARRDRRAGTCDGCATYIVFRSESWILSIRYGRICDAVVRDRRRRSARLPCSVIRTSCWPMLDWATRFGSSLPPGCVMSPVWLAATPIAVLPGAGDRQRAVPEAERLRLLHDRLRAERDAELPVRGVARDRQRVDQRDLGLRARTRRRRSSS